LLLICVGNVLAALLLFAVSLASVVVGVIVNDCAAANKDPKMVAAQRKRIRYFILVSLKVAGNIFSGQCDPKRTLTLSEFNPSTSCLCVPHICPWLADVGYPAEGVSPVARYNLY
jgi:predicted cation transporter